ncbi:hypothetical protein OG394_39965 [Kribbella sp. NBC_01245]|uniref:hypothetical protein n=1 Tax=Kribbella sp. NBC_01245 TaxID=2903578 RepID=UPI002E28757E|nr:hypothetical protein [Kribbella sp. NBC_01245]
MARLEPFLALASAVTEGRLSAQEFAIICLPLYKNYPDPFPSREHFELATELFYLANDYADEPFDDLIGADQVRERTAQLAIRMHALLRDPRNDSVADGEET